MGTKDFMDKIFGLYSKNMHNTFYFRFTGF